MLDQKKRTTLKIMGGSVAAFTIPASFASAANPFPSYSDSTQSFEPVTELLTDSGYNLDVSISLVGQATVRLRNNTDKLIIVKHVYPGIVHAGGMTFDINSVFENSYCAICAGETRSRFIEPVSPVTAERPFRKGLRASKPVKVVQVTDLEGVQDIAHSNRSFFV